jgi:hypothetical protein
VSTVDEVSLMPIVRTILTNVGEVGATVGYNVGFKVGYGVGPGCGT